jgi:hypothetical protein
MSQNHVDLLMKAAEVPESLSVYLCDRIGAVVGYYHESEYIAHKDKEFGGKNDLMWSLRDMITKNIKGKFSFDETPYAKEGMTREQWTKEVLAPLALALEED